MRTLRLFLFLLPAIALAQRTQLSTLEISAFKKEVSQLAQDIESISSDFTQVKYMELMEDEAVSNGRLYYRAPNVLKWEYQQPYNYKILFRDNQLHIDDEGDKTVTSLRSNKLFEKLVGLISGSVNGKLLADTDNFEISFYRVDNKFIQAVVIPRDASMKGMFSEIILLFNDKNLVDSVKLMEEAGDYTHIKFKNLKMNQQLGEDVFQN